MNTYLNDFRDISLRFTFLWHQAGLSPQEYPAQSQRCLSGLIYMLLPGSAGCNFKILFKVCFASAAPWDSLHWVVQSCASGTGKVGQGLNQHLCEAVEPRYVIRRLGRGGGDFVIRYRGKGSTQRCYLQGWAMTLTVAVLLHDSC